MEEPKPFLPNGHTESHADETFQEDMEVDSSFKDDSKKTKADESITRLGDEDKSNKTEKQLKEEVEEEEEGGGEKKDSAGTSSENLESGGADKVDEDLRSTESEGLPRSKKKRLKSCSDVEVEDSEKKFSDENEIEKRPEKGPDENLEAIGNDDKDVSFESVEGDVPEKATSAASVNKKSEESVKAVVESDVDKVKASSSSKSDLISVEDIKKEDNSGSESEVESSEAEFCGFESPSQEKSQLFGRMLDDLMRDCMTPTDEGMEEESGGSYDRMRDEGEVKDEISSTSSTPSVKSSSGSSRKRNKEKVIKKPMDISLPQFHKPFEYGWKRELVYRNTSEAGTKRNADIYYYTPHGKKVRSTREVLEFLLGTDLTADNFTFFKEPINVNDPTKEVIREAKCRIDKEPCGTPPPAKKPALLKAPGSSNRSTSPGSSKMNNFSNNNDEEVSSPKVSLNTTPKIVLKSFKPTIKVKSAKQLQGKIGSSFKDKGRHDSDDELEMGMLPPLWPSPPDKSTAREISPSSKMSSSGGASGVGSRKVDVEVCSIGCPLAMGLVPTLQCHICLCLYHPECVGLEEAINRTIHSYVCINCQEAKKSGKQPSTGLNKVTPPILSTPPPLTPISTLGVNGGISQAGTTSGPPKLQRLMDAKLPTTSKSQKIVGGVTTWLPPSSMIQLTSKNTSPTKSSSSTVPAVATVDTTSPLVTMPAQNLLHMNGKRTGGGVKRPIEENDRLPSAKRAKKETSGKPDSDSQLNVPKTAEPAHPPDAAIPASAQPQVVESSSVSVNKDYFMTNVSAIYKALLHSFQYLKVQELLRASRVCQLWKDVALHRSLWQTVRMKNSRVRDWEGFANTLRTTGTKHLDLRKMLVPDKQESHIDMWTEYSRVIDRVNMLLRIDMCRCPGSAVEHSARANNRLQYLSALAIRCSTLDISAFENCKNLMELRLKSSEKGGMELKKLASLKSLVKMKHLSLLTVRSKSADMEDLVQVLDKLKDLETLELGECTTLPHDVATEAIPKLKRLQRLRLEKGQGPACPTVALLQAVGSLPHLTQLELINFDIKPGFDTALSHCTNLRTLLIIPTYVTQSATTNHVIMEGVSKLSKTLTHFVWGITLELLRVTDLFIDQWEGQKGPIKSPPSSTNTNNNTNTTTGNTNNAPPKKGAGDSIPILKPLNEDGVKEGSTPSQVDILQLPKLHKVLTTLLPSTKIKILKVPFTATWRQTVAGPSHSQ